MKKIIYLFGAGASRETLPIVNEIPDRLKNCIRILKSPKYLLSDSETFINLKGSKRAIQEQLIDDLNWLLTESKNHASVDTFAKKLFLKGAQNDLRRLKAALTVFLSFEQCKNPADKRYDSFFASILRTSCMDFPNNIRIVSWNYDSQFEISFSEYSESKDILRNQSLLNINIKDRIGINTDKFAIYKLNGTTGYSGDGGLRQLNYIHWITNTISIQVIEALVNNYGYYIYNPNIIRSTLSFAWEQDLEEGSIVMSAINSIKGAQILIIIGYSFPFFNREIDTLIINSLDKLEKVYFQSPDAEVIQERFQAIRTNISQESLILKRDTGQFLLPNEL